MALAIFTNDIQIVALESNLHYLLMSGLLLWFNNWETKVMWAMQGHGLGLGVSRWKADWVALPAAVDHTCRRLSAPCLFE